MAVPLPENARQMLDRPNLAHIATVMRDGSPQVSPLWVERDGDIVLVNTAEGRLKTRNVRRDPRVAISLVDRDSLRPALLIRGRVVEEITGMPAWEQFRKLAAKYSGRAADPNRPPDLTRVLWRIEVDRVTVE
jgi:PPOX class probable F420-dependent enzyme